MSETIKVYSAFSHSFSASSKNTEIHYYESKYVKGPNNSVICIDSAKEEAHGTKFNSIIGKTFIPEYRIELWATNTFEERKVQDFIKLKMTKQIIHFCNGTNKIVSIDDLKLVSTH